MTGLDFGKINRVLCLGAHSDDIEIGCGGTILKIVESRPDTEFYWAVFSGDTRRQEEARGSAEDFLQGGRVKAVRTESFRERYFPSEWGAIKDAFESIRRDFEPDLVFTQYRDDRHQDHRVLSDLAWNTFRNHLVLEYEIPKYDGDLGIPNVFVELEAARAKRKAELIQKHFNTQTNKHWFEKSTFLALMRIRGVECAASSGYAEAFYGRKLVLGC